MNSASAASTVVMGSICSSSRRRWVAPAPSMSSMTPNAAIRVRNRHEVERGREDEAGRGEYLERADALDLLGVEVLDPCLARGGEPLLGVGELGARSGAVAGGQAAGGRGGEA